MSENKLFPAFPAPPDYTVDWDMLLQTYPWLHSLDNCPQDPIHHAEGDVLIHTRMVAEALAADSEWQALDDTNRDALFAAALLHDISKPETTRLEDGRITSKGHAWKGALRAQHLLYQEWHFDQAVSFGMRRKIVGLVRHHGLPLWLWDREDIQRSVIMSSLQSQNDLVAILARADVRGRLAQDRDELLERIELFKECCAEYGCLDQPYPFPSNLSRFAYFHSVSRAPQYDVYNDTKLNVVLMSGLPGAGKDTWVEHHAEGKAVISLDALRSELAVDPADDQGAVVKRAQELARDYLRREQPFIWNATNVSRQLREGLIDMIASYKGSVHVIYVETPWDELMRRNHARSRSIPPAVLRNLARKLEVPDLTEAHQVDWITTG